MRSSILPQKGRDERFLRRQREDEEEEERPRSGREERGREERGEEVTRAALGAIARLRTRRMCNSMKEKTANCFPIVCELFINLKTCFHIVLANIDEMLATSDHIL